MENKQFTCPYCGEIYTLPADSKMCPLCGKRLLRLIGNPMDELDLVSTSRLKTADVTKGGCLRAFYLSYLSTYGRMPSGDPAWFGKLCHDALLALGELTAEFGEQSDEVLRQVVNSLIRDKVAYRKFASRTGEAIVLVRNGYRWFLERFSDLYEVETEKRFEIVLDPKQQPEGTTPAENDGRVRRYQGFRDVTFRPLIQEVGHPIILDYKTNREPYPLKTEVDGVVYYDHQLASYAWSLFQEGYKKVEVALGFLREGVIESAVITEEDILPNKRWAFGMVNLLCSLIPKGLEAFQPNKGCIQCTVCYAPGECTNMEALAKDASGYLMDVLDEESAVKVMEDYLFAKTAYSKFGELLKEYVVKQGVPYVTAQGKFFGAFIPESTEVDKDAVVKILKEHGIPLENHVKIEPKTFGSLPSEIRDKLEKCISTVPGTPKYEVRSYAPKPFESKASEEAAAEATVEKKPRKSRKKDNSSDSAGEAAA